MKRTFAVFAFVLALTVSSFAASTSPASQPLSKQQLASLIASAKTPADHLKISAYYHAQAESYLAQSNLHARMAADLAGNPVTSDAKNARGTVQHCQYLATSLMAKSVRAEQLAKLHEQMAKDAAQN